MDRRELLLRLLDDQMRNVAFRGLCALIEGLGFELRRMRGSHRVYRRIGIPDRMVV